MKCLNILPNTSRKVSLRGTRSRTDRLTTSMDSLDVPAAHRNSSKSSERIS